MALRSRSTVPANSPTAFSLTETEHCGLALISAESITSLNRKIRGTLDVSPNNLIRIERLKAAAQMLKNGDAKVNEVCYGVGFTSPSYFTKCFYQQFGLLPKEFAKQGKEEK